LLRPLESRTLLRGVHARSPRLWLLEISVVMFNLFFLIIVCFLKMEMFHVCMQGTKILLAFGQRSRWKRGSQS
jgi:hypothetical protein